MPFYQNKTTNEISEFGCPQDLTEWTLVADCGITNAQNAAKNQLIVARENFQYKDVTYNAAIYKATNSAQNKLVNKIAQGIFPFQWSDSFGNIINLTQIEAIALQALMLAQEDFAYKQYYNYLIQINACTTAAQVEALTFTFS
jgi:hypothetical protein